MKLYSTHNPEYLVDVKTAVIQSMAPDKGLFMPQHLLPLPQHFFDDITDLSFQDIALEVAHHLLEDSVPLEQLQIMVNDAINFDAPVVSLDKQVGILELFHGPTMAFKDFGARFMARLMRYFLTQEVDGKAVTVLVATSGDTGGAVAQGFYQVDGVNVIVLYPKGLVSDLQERQFTTLDHNITALEVNGTFDDCQRLVKEAFLDAELNEHLFLTSANSINVARLIPQTFYYFYAYAQLLRKGIDTSNLVFSVPSGNYGNLTAGLIAQKLGLPVKRFIASANRNDIVPQYLETGEFKPKHSVPTIANAMDIGNPSNFVRLQELCGPNQSDMQRFIWGHSFDDEAIIKAIVAVQRHYGYILDPHTAVGYLGLQEYLKEVDSGAYGVVLSTAHPAKFLEVYESHQEINFSVQVPERLEALKKLEKHARPMTADFAQLKAFLLEQ